MTKRAPAFPVITHPILSLMVFLIWIIGGALSTSPVQSKPIDRQDRVTLQVGGDWNYPPYEFLDKGVPSGYNIELIRAVADVMGLEINIQLGPWNQVRKSLEDGEIDILAGMYFSEERDQKVDFSIPHILVTPGLFVRNDSPIHQFEDIQSKRIVVQEGDIMHDFLLTSGFDLEITTMSDPADLLNAISMGNFDAALLSSSAQGQYLIDQYRFSNLRLIPTDLPARRYCFAVQEGNQTILNQLNEGLFILQKSGEYQKIHEKWLGVYDNNSFWQKARPYLIVFALVLAGLVLALLWARILRKQVEHRTRQWRLSEERYANAFHTSPDMITITRLSDGAYIEVNEGFVNLTGFSPAEVLGKTPVELGIWLDGTMRTELLAKLQHQNSLVNQEVRLRRKDGVAWDASISAHQIEFNGEACSLWIIRDITNRKQIELRIQRQVARLESLRRVDSAIIAHLGMQETFEALLRQLQDQLDVSATAVLLYDNERQSFICLAQRGMRAPDKFNSFLQEITVSQNVFKNALSTSADEETCYEMDETALRYDTFKQEGFVTACSVLFTADENHKGILQIFNRGQLPLDEDWKHYLHIMAGQAAIVFEHASLFETLQKRNLALIQAYDETIAGWATALELRDMETQNHSLRVAQMTSRLARAMGIQGEDFVHFRRGALLHDIGKMSIPDAILHKPGPLTKEEWDVMRQHPVHAYNLLSPVDFLRPALDIPYCHHENWDGSGYPRGLSGEQIPIAARIFAVVDNWDALSSNRPYRQAWPKEKVVEYLRDQEEKKFDPQVVSVFLKLLEKDSSQMGFSD